MCMAGNTQQYNEPKPRKVRAINKEITSMGILVKRNPLKVISRFSRISRFGTFREHSRFPGFPTPPI